MDEIPLLEHYMKLRASGHHVSEEDEQRIMHAMLARVAEVQNFESTGAHACFPVSNRMKFSVRQVLLILVSFLIH